MTKSSSEWHEQMKLLIKKKDSRSLPAYLYGFVGFTTITIMYYITGYFFTMRKLSSIKNNYVQGGLGSKCTHLKNVSLVFLTASSANHVLTLLLDNLPSIENWVLNATTPTFLPLLKEESISTKADVSVRVIHYNLDPVKKRALKKNQANIEEIRHKFPFVELREFNYSAYPSYFNIEIAKGEYAFKPVIVEEVAKELRDMDANNSTFCTTSNNRHGLYSQSYLYYLDAGVKIEDGGSPFQKDFQIAKNQGIYTPLSTIPLKQWTVKGTADYLNLDHEIYESPEARIGSGGIVLFDLKNETIYDKVIKPWMTCARVKDCIAPKGSSRSNHRQDQSALSVILHKNKISIHNNTGSIVRGRQ